ncbi:MAG: HlyD family efflux transporter periplasmic adaptor subunit [Bacteroidetes bacterium]|nr:HlyD family efflux transporter periplasmic adaptor subunit [Bacteroidota bacterium]
MENDPVFIRHSEEIQDIMTKVPSGLIRWGMTCFLLIFLLLIGLAAFVKYPDIVTTSAKITACGENGIASGKAIIPQNAIAKIHNGEAVVIKLTSYPFEQYGILKGELKSISRTSDNHGYFSAEVLIRSNVTDIKKKILFQPGMLAEAEIITEDESVLHRLRDHIFR